MRDETTQDGLYEKAARPAGVSCALLACLLTCLFFSAPLQLSARTNQSLPRQIEEEPLGEETHENRVKAPKSLNSWRKTQHRAQLTRVSLSARAVLSDFEERWPDIDECWDAHSHRRRGPPASLLS